MTTTVPEPPVVAGPDGRSRPGADGVPRRRLRLPLIIAGAVAVVVALLVAVLATSKSATQVEDEASSVLIGKTAPAISGPLVSGGAASLADDRGKWVLVNFFASWCVPCQQEQGELVSFQDRHTSSGDAVIFGVRFDDPDVGPIRALMDRSGGHWPIVDDSNAKFDWGVTGPPESFIVDPDGVVVVHIVGQVNANQLDALLGRLEALRGGASSAGPTTAGPTTAGPTTAGPTTAGPTTAGDG